MTSLWELHVVFIFDLGEIRYLRTKVTGPNLNTTYTVLYYRRFRAVWHMLRTKINTANLCDVIRRTSKMPVIGYTLSPLSVHFSRTFPLLKYAKKSPEELEIDLHVAHNSCTTFEIKRSKDKITGSSKLVVHIYIYICVTGALAAGTDELARFIQ